MPDNELMLKIKGDSSSAKAALGSLDKSLGGVKGTVGALAGAFIASGAAIMAADFLKDSIAKAKEEQVEVARLQVAIGNTGASYSAYAGQIEEAATAAISMGYADDDMIRALANLTTSTGSVTTAMRDQQLVMDLARYTGKSLADSATMIAKAEEGKIGIIARQLPFLNAQMTAEEALAALRKAVAGQAAAYALSDAGATAIRNASYEQLQETIGMQVLPIEREFTLVLIKALGLFNKLSPAMQTGAVDVVVWGGALALGAGAVVKLNGALVSLGIVSATSGGALSSVGVGMSLYAGGAGVAEIATLGLGAAVGALAIKLAVVAAPLALFAYTLMRTDNITSYQQAVYALEGGMKDLQTRVAAGVTTWGEAKAALDKGAFSTLTAAQKANVARLAETELAGAIGDTTEAWKAQVLALSDSQNAMRSLTDNAVSAHAAEKARADFLKGGGKKDTAEYNQLIQKTHDAYALLAQSASTMTDAEIKAAVKSGILTKAQGDLAKKANDASGKVDGVTTALGNVPTSTRATVSVIVNASALDTLLARLHADLGKAGISVGKFGVEMNLTPKRGPLKAHGGFSPGYAQSITWGEDGAEAIVPLSQRYRADALAILPGVLDAVGVGAGAGSGTTVNITQNIAQNITRDVDIDRVVNELTFKQTVALRTAGVIA